MKRIHVADDPILVGYLKSVLEAAGISCIVRNEMLIGASGELPPNECWPELWVIDERDATVAGEIIARALETPAPGASDWICAHCGEDSEAQFQVCWSCGSLRR